jgi:hypothetical protein
MALFLSPWRRNVTNSGFELPSVRNRRDILSPVLRDGLKPVLVGLGAGLAFIVSRLIRSLLFAITALNGLTYCLAIAMLIAVAIAACWFPSRAATGTDPIASLRYE